MKFHANHMCELLVELVTWEFYLNKCYYVINTVHLPLYRNTVHKQIRSLCLNKYYNVVTAGGCDVQVLCSRQFCHHWRPRGTIYGRWYAMQ